MFKEELDLVLLAGGRGKRISRFTKNTPKPLLKINNKSFLQYLLNYYSKYNFTKIYILAGYKGSKIKKIYHKKKINLIPIECIVEKKLLGTGGALNLLKKIIKRNFLLINGDSFLKINLDNFLKKKLNKNIISRMALIKNKNYKSNNKLSNLSIKNNIVNNSGNLMNAGVYFFKKKILNYCKNSNFSLETDLINKLILRKKIEGKLIKSYFIDIGTYANLKIAKKTFTKNFATSSAFFDRDGVLNDDKGYTYKMRDLKFKKNVFKTLKMLNKKNINIFIITNQSGIARGYYNENNFFDFQRKFKKILDKKNIYINDVRYCPYHKNAKIKKYRKNSLYRKPGNLMIEDLKKKWDVNTKKSFMIGDKKSDMLAAKKSKIYYEYAKVDIFQQVKRICKNLRI